MGNAKKSTSSMRVQVEEAKAYLDSLTMDLVEKIKEEEIAVLEHQVLFVASEEERKKVEDLTTVANQGKRAQATMEVQEWLNKGDLDEDVVEYLAMKREQRLARVAGMNNPPQKKEAEKENPHQIPAANTTGNTQPNAANLDGMDENMQGSTQNKAQASQGREPGSTGIKTPEESRSNRTRSRSPPM